MICCMLKKNGKKQFKISSSKKQRTLKNACSLPHPQILILIMLFNHIDNKMSSGIFWFF